MSRYPVSGRGGYDKSLLQIAPQVTKADRQQGYNVDILQQGGPSNFYGPQFGPNAPRQSPPQQPAQGYEQPRSQQRQPLQQPVSADRPSLPSLEQADYYSSSAALDQRDTYEVNPYKPPKKPWFRTKRGLFVIFIIVLLLAGGVVGIAVGISTAKNMSKGDEKGAREGAKEGSAGGLSSAEAGSRGTDTDVLPSLHIITLSDSQRPPATAATPVGLVPTANPNPAASAIGQTFLTATEPTRTTGPTFASVGPTPSVDPVCLRFPTLSSCQRR